MGAKCDVRPTLQAGHGSAKFVSPTGFTATVMGA